MAPNHRKQFWCPLDPCEGFINGVDKALSCNRRPLEIPVVGFENLRLGMLANPQWAHSTTLPGEFGLDLGPRLARFGIGVRIGFAPIEFGGQRRSYRRSERRIQAVPQIPDKLDPLLCG